MFIHFKSTCINVYLHIYEYIGIHECKHSLMQYVAERTEHEKINYQNIIVIIIIIIIITTIIIKTINTDILD